MLVNFRFKNSRSFYEETVLSMEAVKDSELEDLNTFSVNEKLMRKDENRLLKSSVIFGGNASGKTNVIKALAYMKAVLDYSASSTPIVKLNETFAFYEHAGNEVSLYEVEIIQNDIFYRYGFTILHGEIISEWLDKRKERLTSVFKRKGNTLEITGNKAATKLINLSSNALFLSVGNLLNLAIASDLKEVLAWFRKLLVVFENDSNSLEIYGVENGKYREQALKILRLADIGIVDVEVKKDKINREELNEVLQNNTAAQIRPRFLRREIKQEDSKLFNIDLQTTFDVYNADKKRIGKKSVMLFKDIDFNSEGTMRLLCYLGWLLAALDQGRVIVIDEVDAKLHFLVADYLIQLFNSIDKNPKNAQLICTAHNVMLMDDGLRRDQIYFTSKDQYGESHLAALSDFKNVRKTDLFSKRYLAGFYSGLPDMTNDD